MFLHLLFDRAHKFAAGGCLLGEIQAFFTNDRIQQIGYLIGGAAIFISHFWWNQKKEKRKNGVLDVLATKVKHDIREGKPLPYPELIHLLVDHDDEIRGAASEPKAS